MMAEYYITEQESRLIAPLAVRGAIERSLGDPHYLRNLVRAYVGSAVAAEDALLERCAGSPEYLESFVKKYVATLDERELINLLRATAGDAAIAAQLGFNPFDRRRKAAYDSARRFLNCRAQGVVLTNAALALCLICLFPPWKMERWERQQWNPCSSGGCMPPPDKKLEVRFAGFRFISAPDPSQTPAPRNPSAKAMADNRSPNNVQGSQIYVVYKFYYEMWLLEVLGLFGIAVGLCAALRDRRSFEQRVAAIEAARSGL